MTKIKPRWISTVVWKIARLLEVNVLCRHQICKQITILR